MTISKNLVSTAQCTMEKCTSGGWLTICTEKYTHMFVGYNTSERMKNLVGSANLKPTAVNPNQI